MKISLTKYQNFIVKDYYQDPLTEEKDTYESNWVNIEHIGSKIHFKCNEPNPDILLKHLNTNKEAVVFFDQFHLFNRNFFMGKSKTKEKKIELIAESYFYQITGKISGKWIFWNEHKNLFQFGGYILNIGFDIYIGPEIPNKNLNQEVDEDIGIDDYLTLTGEFVIDLKKDSKHDNEFIRIHGSDEIDEKDLKIEIFDPTKN